MCPQRERWHSSNLCALRVYNYGAIGSIVGHELTHNYDDIGALFDQLGNHRQWWDDATFRQFEARKQCLIDQYSKFAVPEAGGEKVDGEKTQGENIGDLGGVKEAYIVGTIFKGSLTYCPI